MPNETTNSRADPRRLAFELGRAFARLVDLDGLLAFAVAKCREVLAAAGVAILFLDRQANQLYFPYAAEDDPVVAARVKRARLPIGRGIAGAVLASGRSLRVDDVTLDSRFYPGVDQVTGFATRSIVCAPLLSAQGPIGLIEAVNPIGRDTFSDDDLNLLDVVAQNLAEAVEEHQREGPLSHVKHPVAAGKRECGVFRCEGDFWVIEFGDHSHQMKDAAGLHYIALLLNHPDREFHVLDLIHAWGRSRLPSAAVGQRGLNQGLTVLDAQAKAAYKRRLEELSEELEDAERMNDVGRAERIGGEKDCVTQQLVSALGLGGRDRSAGGDVERARSAVTKRIRQTIRKIKAENPVLARHLFGQVRTGQYCKYVEDPERMIVWRL